MPSIAPYPSHRRGLCGPSITAIALAAGSTATTLLPESAIADPLAEPLPLTLELSDLDGVIGMRAIGVDAGDQAGASVSVVGDINGDGIDDLLIGAPAAEPGTGGQGQSQGEAYVLFGRTGGFPAALALDGLDGADGFRLRGAAAFDFAGVSVASAGDVNNDGVADLIVGARARDLEGRPRAGQAYIVFGRPADQPFPAEVDLGALDGGDGFVVRGADALDRAYTVSAAGDLNGDGIDDVAIGAATAGPGALDGAGAVYVVYGRTDGFAPIVDLADLDGANGVRFDGAATTDDRAGHAVAGVGDVNGDGRDDLLIGAASAPRPDAGKAYVVFGRDARDPFPSAVDLSGLDGARGFRIEGAFGGDAAGFAVAAAGDVNGDGVNDMALGAPYARFVPGPEAQLGETYVVFGRDAGFPFPAVLGVLDLDGEIGFRMVGASLYDASGSAIAGVGDINGDGLDDLAVATPGGDAPDRPDAGEVTVVFGRVGTFPASIDLADVPGDPGSPTSAIGVRLVGVGAGDGRDLTVSAAGDINADGIADMAIGAPRVDDGPLAQSAGTAYVVFGRRSPAVCSADLDGDGQLSVFDFLAFQNLFDDQDPRSDFDGDGSFTVFDFLAFQNAFDTGC